MSALGSSIINKSTRKFAPKKAPARRQADTSSSQTLARPHAERSLKKQIIQTSSAQPRTTESPVAQIFSFTPAPRLPATSPFVDKHQRENKPLPIADPGRDPSVSRASSLQQSVSQNQTPDKRQTPELGAAIVPTSLAASSWATPVLVARDSVPSAQPIHALKPTYEDSPPAKRRRVSSRQNPTWTASRPLLTADPNVALPTTEDSDMIRREEVGDEDVSILAEPATAKRARVRRLGRSEQDLAKVVGTSTETATVKIRKPQKSRRTYVAQPDLDNAQDQDDNGKIAQPMVGQDSGVLTTNKPRKLTKGKGKEVTEKAAAAIVNNAVKGSSRSSRRRGRPSKRMKTPDEAQHVRINVSETKMADLCRDGGTGQKSSADEIIRENERAAVFKKKQQEVQSMVGQAEESTAQDLEVRESRLDRLDREWRKREEAMANSVPQQRIVNGQIVLDTSSLRIDRHAMAAVERDAEQLESVEEDEYTRKVNSSLGLKRDKSGGWNEMLVDRFYDGLRMFGTDFGMISKLFPGKSRHSIKLKFCKEEKGDYPRIRAALLGEVLSVELEDFQKMTGEEYDDPAILERDIEEDKRKLEEEQEREKAAIEAARRERAEQAEAERLASQGKDSSSKEIRKKRKKKGGGDRKQREKGEKIQKGPTRTKQKKSHGSKGTLRQARQESLNEGGEKD